MRVHSATLALVASLSLQIPFAFGFVPSTTTTTSRVAAPRDVDDIIQRRLLQRDDNRRLHDLVLRSTSTEETENASPPAATKKKRKLGLITFDLDDTLYPIAPVLDEANSAFSSAMSNFGYTGIGPGDIVEAGKEIRANIAEESGDSNFYGIGGTDDPLRPTTVNHKEIRMAAIRKEMEKFILETKLRQTAEDWATNVEDLTGPVRKSAEKWARTTVHSSVVQAVYNAWEMERHHAAERHLFPDAITAIKSLQADHPDVIIGAVTDGSANPMLMVFSLMPLFDFTVSWEDDIEKVQAQMDESRFLELSSVDRSDDLSWIYGLAVEKGREMSALTDDIKKNGGGEKGGGKDDDVEWCWVHVGDDLAYDVGGSATTGAKTVLVELAPEYGQTARLRKEGERPEWATETSEQCLKHREMMANAEDKVDARITHLSQLPEVINELLKGDDDGDE